MRDFSRDYCYEESLLVRDFNRLLKAVNEKKKLYVRFWANEYNNYYTTNLLIYRHYDSKVSLDSDLSSSNYYYWNSRSYNEDGLFTFSTRSYGSGTIVPAFADNFNQTSFFIDFYNNNVGNVLNIQSISSNANITGISINGYDIFKNYQNNNINSFTSSTYYNLEPNSYYRFCVYLNAPEGVLPEASIEISTEQEVLVSYLDFTKASYMQFFAFCPIPFSKFDLERVTIESEDCNDLLIEYRYKDIQRKGTIQTFSLVHNLNRNLYGRVFNNVSNLLFNELIWVDYHNIANLELIKSIHKNYDILNSGEGIYTQILQIQSDYTNRSLYTTKAVKYGAIVSLGTYQPPVQPPPYVPPPPPPKIVELVLDLNPPTYLIPCE